MGLTDSEGSCNMGNKGSSTIMVINGEENVSLFYRGIEEK